MSGPWSKACDQYNEPLEPAWAALLIARAAWYAANGKNAGMHPKWEVEKAGSVIRAWRKSLPEQTQRIADYDDRHEDHDLLWWALRRVAEARNPCAGSYAQAEDLRYAETMLRTWWKRQWRP